MGGGRVTGESDTRAVWLRRRLLHTRFMHVTCWLKPPVSTGQGTEAFAAVRDIGVSEHSPLGCKLAHAPGADKPKVARQGIAKCSRMVADDA